MTSPRVAIVAGARTPFVKAGQAFAKLSPLVELPKIVEIYNQYLSGQS